MVAGDRSRRIDLAHLPFGVLPGFVGAGQVELGAALSPEAAAFCRARPGLVYLKLLGRPREGEGCRFSGHGLSAVVVDVAEEEVVQRVGGSRALCIKNVYFQ